MALPIPLPPDLFVKKDTVSGIKGNTQGVSNQINPPNKPRIKMLQRLLSPVSLSPQSFTGLLMSIDGISILVVEAAPPSNGTLNKYAAV